MYTTDIQESGTVSASDQERLPPGGFSLRHGFPDWFGRGRRSMADAKHTSGQRVTSPGTAVTSDSTTTAPELPSYMRTGQKSVSAYEVLHYIRSAFDDEEVLDSVPLAAAGNPGAWHAWRTQRKVTGNLVQDGSDEEQKNKEETKSSAENTKAAPSTTTPRQPGEWNWDGVWEDRVKKNVASSLSEPVLYGETKTSDDLIKFLAMEDSDIDSVKDNLQRTLAKTT
ncbi:hypothetical protein ACHAP5_002233 [Fusarium lateritium]